MKQAMTILIATVLSVGTTVAVVNAQGATKPEKGMIVGQVIELSTYAMKGVSEELVDAHRSRIEEGFPVGILEDETGDIWVAVYKNNAPASHLETGNKRLAEFVGVKVVVQGLKYRAKGANVIRVSTASEY